MENSEFSFRAVHFKYFIARFSVAVILGNQRMNKHIEKGREEKAQSRIRERESDTINSIQEKERTEQVVLPLV